MKARHIPLYQIILSSEPLGKHVKVIKYKRFTQFRSARKYALNLLSVTPDAKDYYVKKCDRHDEEHYTKYGYIPFR
jgi:hypothetical protein